MRHTIPTTQIQALAPCSSRHRIWNTGLEQPVQGAGPHLHPPCHVTQAQPFIPETDGGGEIHPGLRPAQPHALGPGVFQPRPGSLDDTHPFLFSNPPEDGDQQGANWAAHVEPRLLHADDPHAHGVELEDGRQIAHHLFRHTMATLTLENRAEVRYIQEMLGHAELSTTQIYTQVSIRKLKEVHTLTHPGARKGS